MSDLNLFYDDGAGAADAEAEAFEAEAYMRNLRINIKNNVSEYIANKLFNKKFFCFKESGIKVRNTKGGFCLGCGNFGICEEGCLYYAIWKRNLKN